jgi:nucleotide-binding universal stress UspA family protein
VGRGTTGGVASHTATAYQVDIPPNVQLVEMQAKFDELRDALRSYAPPGVRFEQRLVIDDVVTGILSTADRLGADLVAVGTHGPGLVARLLLGSVTESVLRRTARPVLASPPPSP